jgi:hypothetical protein
MSDDVKPATNETVATVREMLHLGFRPFDAATVARLLARLDAAEKTAAHDNELWRSQVEITERYVLQRDAAEARVRELRQSNAIANEEIIRLNIKWTGLEKRVKELEAARQWQPIETRLEDGKPVLTSDGLYCEIRNHWGIPAYANFTPTHWQSLPEPPGTSAP